MPSTTINGATIHWQERGSSGPVVILTPGGRWGGYIQSAVATSMSDRCRVITWDRRNSDGASDIVIGGEMSEAEMWAEDLAGLINHLGVAPCFVGEYAGCRTTPWLCIKHPELVKGLVLAWASGGRVPAERLPRNFYQQYINAAEQGGMPAVAGVDCFARSVPQNSGNLDRLLAMDPQEFISTMKRWETAFSKSLELPIAGCLATEQQWASIKVPSIIVPGCDPIHPTDAGQNLHRILPNNEYHDPVVTIEEWEAVFGHNPYLVTSNLQGSRVAPVWQEFILRHAN